MLSPTLKKYVRFVVLLDPVTLAKHSYSISGVKSTEGALFILNVLEHNVQRKHGKKSVVAWLCDSVIRGYQCCLGVHCPNVHVTNQGYKTRRPWDKTYTEKAKKGKFRTPDDEGGEVEGEEEENKKEEGGSRYTQAIHYQQQCSCNLADCHWLARQPKTL